MMPRSRVAKIALCWTVGIAFALFLAWLQKRWTESDDGRLETGEPSAVIESTDDSGARRSTEPAAPEVAGEGGIASEPLPTTPGPVVHGHVIDGARLPISEAVIRLSVAISDGAEGAAPLESRTGADGSFSIAGVGAGRWLLTVEADGFLAHRREVEVPSGDLEITLDRGRSIRGRVEFEGGRPAPGAAIEVSFDPAARLERRALNALRGASGKAVSNAEGGFVVNGLGDGPFLVQASAKADPSSTHAWRTRRAGVEADTDDLVLTLTPPLALRGSVVDENGSPIETFHVRLARGGLSERLWTPASADVQADVVDDEGRFAIEGLESGRWRIHVTAPGFAASPSIEVDLARSPETPEQRIVLHRGGVATGIVVDPEGALHAGAQVTLRLDLARMMDVENGRLVPPRALSDAAGRFRIEGLAAGRAKLFAVAAGFAASEPVIVEVGAGATASDIRIELRRAASIRGTVWNAEGRPTAGVRIMAQCMRDMQTGSATTGQDGRYVIADLAPSTWNLTAVFPRRSGDSTKLDMKAAVTSLTEGETKEIDFGRPGAGCMVTGTVIQAGAPIADAALAFLAADESSAVGGSTMTGADGRFSISLAPGIRYRIEVRARTSAGAETRREIERTLPDAPHARLEIELPGARLSGRVTGRDGQSYPGLSITLSQQAGTDGSNITVTKTDAKGRYEIGFLSAGIYRLAAGTLPGGASEGSAGYASVEGIEVRDGEWRRDVDIELAEVGALSGIVRDRQGRGVPGATIFLRDASGNPVEIASSLASDADGRFFRFGLTAGNYTMTARSGATASRPRTAVVDASGRSDEVVLVLEPGVMLKVVISDRDGNAAPAALSVRDESGFEQAGLFSLSAVFGGEAWDPTGRTQVVGPLLPGEYRLRAARPSGTAVERRVVIDGDRSSATETIVFLD